jgi:UDP-N-acetylmuramoylalanine--D-glutamate ligase
MTDVRGKRVLVVGLARTGRAAVQCLYRRGAVVTVTDSRPPWALQTDIRELMAQRIGVELGLHRAETFQRQDLIVVSPGVLPDLPELQAARARNIPIIPEVEAASWFLEAGLVGVTGSNGKTTTTALLGKMLETSGFRTFVGGNIGVPLISAVDKVPRDALVVAELSSFQLETIQSFRPHVAVLLNLTGNHLDRHPSFEAYVQAKAQIFRNQSADDFAVLNADDPMVMNLAPAIAARKVYFSRKQNLPEGVFAADGRILYRVGNLERVLLRTQEVPLRGEFNLENVLAAAAAACVLGADFEALRRAVREFRAVEHRLEYVREIRGVQFYNDSKATSVDAVVKALSAFERGVHLILGGKDKGAAYAPLRPLLKQRVRKAYLIGAAAERIARELKGAAELIRAGDLETAVRQAFEESAPGDVILLSPACASFDQFQDFEHRGRVFKELVERLSHEVETAEAARPKDVATPSLVSAPRAAPPQVQPEPALEISGSPQGPAAEEIAPVPGPQVAPAFEAERAPTPEVAEPATPETAPVGAPSVEPAPSEPAAVEIPAAAESAEVQEISESPQAPEEQPPALEQAGPPAGVVSYPELLYVYEVGAEELVYPETELPSAFPEEDLEPLTPEKLPVPEAAADESLPFEVRPSASGTAAGSADGQPGSGESKEADTARTKPTSSEPPTGQGRLPGI